MRKIFLLTLMFLMTVTSAMAMTIGKYEKGFLVPATSHNHANADTVIGIICSDNAEVFWTFFDAESNPIVDSKFRCTANDFVAWSLNENVRNEGNIEGYLVFTADAVEKPKNDWLLDKDGPKIAANAFMVDTGVDDAVVLPVIPLDYEDYKSGVNLRLMGADTLVSLKYGVGKDICQGGPVASTAQTDECGACSDGGGGPSIRDCTCFVDARYWTDPKFNACTKLIIWSTDCLSKELEDNPRCYKQGEQLYCHVAVYDNDENLVSLSIPIGCEYTEINPAVLQGWPDFTEGFIRIPREFLGAGGVVFSYVNSDTLHAKQTLFGAEGCFKLSE